MFGCLYTPLYSNIPVILLVIFPPVCHDVLVISWFWEAYIMFVNVHSCSISSLCWVSIWCFNYTCIYNILQYFTIFYNIVQYCTILYNIVQYCMIYTVYIYIYDMYIMLYPPLFWPWDTQTSGPRSFCFVPRKLWPWLLMASAVLGTRSVEFLVGFAPSGFFCVGYPLVI